MPDFAESLYAFTNSLQPARRAWQQAVTVALADTGVSTSLAITLLLVSRSRNGVQQKLLAEEVGVNPAALVRTLDQAQHLGLLERRSVKGDRRARTIHLLPAGRELAGIMECKVAALRSALLQDIPQADLDTATHVVRLLAERARGYLDTWAESTGSRPAETPTPSGVGDVQP